MPLSALDPPSTLPRGQKTLDFSECRCGSVV